MKDQSHHNRAKAYLEDAMNSRERRAFEAALGQDEALQEAFLQYALAMEQPAGEQEERWREILENIRQEKGPLPEPQLTLFDRLRFAFASGNLWKPALGFAFTVIAALVIWANLALRPNEELINNYFIEAYCPGYAGTERPPADQEAVFEKASNLYCGYTEGGGEALQELAGDCPEFCMADYYLAHWQLKNGQFGPAAEGFEQCLANEERLLQYGYTSLAVPVRLNLLLAQLGAGQNHQDILDGLQRLKQGAGEEARAAEQLYAELSHPLRFLLFR